ncbi:50S ribosomal protein L4 [Propionimicrobium sp. PCR01-08-3]|uniref:50S ribosomal protein L4 n=1 Tax=Propionimicrobium sp. PCR01-08-3 TaxID=3052086 RepID=UPI00255C7332|nr:50S ribosomal protein L4 [Propionimicrobium sp. PCR01-08-3]WIY83182.1 50S ribosomal protein L4 [Propionimicrobium sp. PCR01-08-3]
MSESRSVDVLGADGKKAGTAELPAELFDVTTNVPLIHQVVVAQQAAARQGTHSTKTRSTVSGTGKKPFRQKGTGRARQGSLVGPHYTGGAIAHGPQPRSYAQRTPKKMIQGALRGALSDRAREGLVFVVDQFGFGETPSTKQAVKRLQALGDYVRYLIVLDRSDEISWLSLRNLPGVAVLAVDQLNAYDVVCSDAVVFTQAALEAFVAGPAKGKSVKAVATESEAAAQEDEK